MMVIIIIIIIIIILFIDMIKMNRSVTLQNITLH